MKTDTCRYVRKSGYKGQQPLHPPPPFHRTSASWTAVGDGVVLDVVGLGVGGLGDGGRSGGDGGGGGGGGGDRDGGGCVGKGRKVQRRKGHNKYEKKGPM